MRDVRFVLLLLAAISTLIVVGVAASSAAASATGAIENGSLEKSIADLKSPNRQTRINAALAVAKARPPASSVLPALIAALDDSDGLVRYYASHALSNIGKPAVPELIKAFRSTNSTTRFYAAAALVRIGKDAKAVLPHLKNAFKSPDLFVRRAAIDLVGVFGLEAKELLPQVLFSLNDADSVNRRKAIVALGKIGVPGKEALPVLLRALKDDDVSVRLAALKGLGGLGPEAKSAVKNVLPLLKDGNYNIRKVAAVTLVKISPSKGQTAVQGVLANTDPLDRIRKKSFHKVYNVKMTAGNVYLIDLTSRAFDTYLRLETANGQQVAKDDDGGKGPNSQLTFTPSVTGTYRIIVTTYGARAVGPFSLTIRFFGTAVEQP